MIKYLVALGSMMATTLMAIAACSNANDDVTPTAKRRSLDGSAPGDTGPSGAAPVVETDSGFSLKAFSPPDRSALTAGQILITASGEALAQQGYKFPNSPDNGVFADGWQVQFQHFIVTFDKITLSNNPDKVPTDQSQTDQIVAEADGPWAIDLAKATPNDVAGKEQGETATPITSLRNQNRNGNQSFATDGTKYAAGFSSVVATPNAMNVNLDAEGLTIYEDMIAQGCATLYAGTATFKADPSQCTSQDAEFSRLPAAVNFYLCFKSPTQYINCDNQDIQGAPFGSEPHPRGIAFTTNAYVTGEVTYHTDHPFWESVVHDTPAHFDQFAARATGLANGADGGGAGGMATVKMDDLIGADYLAYTDSLGNPVPWRSCVKDGKGQPYGKGTGRMMFDPASVPKAPPGGIATAAGLRDYYDFTTYNQSTQGHWNGSDGLCFVKRNYPAPP